MSGGHADCLEGDNLGHGSELLASCSSLHRSLKLGSLGAKRGVKAESRATRNDGQETVLVRGLSYKELGIQEGATATVRWNEIVTGQVVAAAAARIRADLLQYCGLDTRAMV